MLAIRPSFFFCSSVERSRDAQMPSQLGSSSRDLSSQRTKAVARDLTLHVQGFCAGETLLLCGLGSALIFGEVGLRTRASQTQNVSLGKRKLGTGLLERTFVSPFGTARRKTSRETKAAQPTGPSTAAAAWAKAKAHLRSQRGRAWTPKTRMGETSEAFQYDLWR